MFDIIVTFSAASQNTESVITRVIVIHARKSGHFLFNNTGCILKALSLNYVNHVNNICTKADYKLNYNLAN